MLMLQYPKSLDLSEDAAAILNLEALDFPKGKKKKLKKKNRMPCSPVSGSSEAKWMGYSSSSAIWFTSSPSCDTLSESIDPGHS